MACLVAGTLFIAGCHEKQKSEKIVEPTKPAIHESEKVPVQNSEVGSNTQPAPAGGAIAESNDPEVEADGVSYIPPIESINSSTEAVASSENAASVPQSTVSPQVGASNASSSVTTSVASSGSAIVSAAPTMNSATTSSLPSISSTTTSNNSAAVQNPGVVQQATIRK